MAVGHPPGVTPLSRQGDRAPGVALAPAFCYPERAARDGKASVPARSGPRTLLAIEWKTPF
jgi:hypothetical protein